ncbi:hypothetical protein SLS62_000014 [Diatrype stigma]|uniref:Heterokaryon incompatibility domain-containing protein n=1 Tax=Diatrype stigma TaxID=117547 RepID=A0AAN9YSQ2_9PEZI
MPSAIFVFTVVIAIAIKAIIRRLPKKSRQWKRQYEPLPQGEFIRLLEILPSPIGDSPLVCNISHCTTTQSERKYEAISYTWGNDTPTNAILLNGEIAYVRDNLWQAIKHMRLIDEIRVVWVDALCINQADLAERASQVAQMAAIYSSAARVALWLGNGNSATDYAMDSLDDLFRVMLQFKRRDQYKSRNDYVCHLLGLFRPWVSLKPENDIYGLLQGIFIILDSPWWTRVWTFQEFAFAGQVMLRCGTRCIDWLALEQFCLLAKVHAAVNPADYNPVSPAAYYYPSGLRSGIFTFLFDQVVMFDAFRKRRLVDQKLTLFHMVRLTEHRLATDPRDKVYGVLSMVNGGKSLALDYSLDVSTVFVSATRIILEESGGMSIYEQLGHMPTRSPSWALPFDNTSRSMASLVSVGVPAGDAADKVPGGSIYNAGFLGEHNKGKSFFQVDEHRKTLAVKGIAIDKASFIGDISPKLVVEPNGQLGPVVRKWKSTLRDIYGEYTRGGSRLDAFWRTVALDCKINGYHHGTVMNRTPKNRQCRLGRHDDLVPPLSRELEDRLLDALDRQTSLELGKSGTWGRPFFETKNGHMGIGVPIMRPGDVICVLLGSRIPFILRHSDNGGFKMIGQW